MGFLLGRLIYCGLLLRSLRFCLDGLSGCGGSGDASVPLSDVELDNQMAAKLAAQLGNAATAEALLPYIKDMGFTWSLPTIAAAQINTIVAYGFGNRPNAASGNTSSAGGNQAALPDPGPTNEALADALERSSRFLRLVLPDLAVSLGRDHGEARLRIVETRPLDIGRVFAFEWLLRLLHGLSSWLVGIRIVLDAVAFPYPRPAHADDYALIYTANSTFADDASGVALIATFAANLLDLPIRRDEAALKSFLVGAPGRPRCSG